MVVAASALGMGVGSGIITSLPGTAWMFGTSIGGSGGAGTAGGLGMASVGTGGGRDGGEGVTAGVTAGLATDSGELSGGGGDVGNGKPFVSVLAAERIIGVS